MSVGTLDSYGSAHNRPRTQAGVAIVTVLAVLTIMALMAMCFTVLLMIEIETSKTSQGRVQSDMMAQSGLQHAMSLLRQDIVEQPGWDDPSEAWKTDSTDPAARQWRIVHGLNGEVVGRYMFEIEDESGKINVNAASACSTNEQNQGTAVFELLLTDGKNRGLPLPIDFARKAVAHRYGRDGKPGRASVDDNLTASRYQGDEIDNNANGIVDEPGEGVDEPEEYMPRALRGDDCTFMSVAEMLDVCSRGGTRLDEKTRLAVKQLATVDSKATDTFWDNRIGTWQSRVNINVADKYQMMDVLTRANTEGQFEPASRDLQQLSANIQDYRDQNHVLTTVGNEYGVEAVCFNEVLSYDASWARETDWTDWWQGDPNCQQILSYNGFYYRHADSASRRWPIQSCVALGGGARLTLKEPTDNNYGRMPQFLKCDTKWPQNFWKDADLEVYDASGGRIGPTYKVSGNPTTSSRELTIKCTPAEAIAINAANNATVRIYSGWNHGWGAWCQEPERNETYFFHPPEKFPLNHYYQVFTAGRYSYNNNWPEIKCKELDVDGDVTKYSELLPTHGKYVYKQGEAQRPNASGYIPVTITSCKRAKNSGGNFDTVQWASYSDSMSFIRPDIIELINISHKPITLRNWAVVVNTGKDAWELTRFDKARYFSAKYGPQFDDPNPTIAANGFFYLTNNREIFALEHASGKSHYGMNATETIPIYQLPHENWGILYKVISAGHSLLKVDGADWYKDQMAGELIEYVITRDWPNHDTGDGHVKYVWGNTKDTLNMAGSDPGSALRPNDYIRFVGLPRQGGFVSFTLKNEYNQVVARTLEYGSIDQHKFGYSTQKHDPTHYNWVTTAKPSIGGTDRLARNTMVSKSTYAQAHIKNNDCVSPAEIQNVRRSKDWQNIGSQNASITKRALRSVGAYVTVNGVRLDPEEEGAHIRGWLPAFGTVRQCTHSSVSVTDAKWSPGIWRNSRLRVLSGPCAGDEFVVTNNSVSSLQIIGYSTSGSRAPAMREGDRISIGPGYLTAMYYTRQDAEVGEWEWTNKDIVPGRYGLYLCGLNDSIVTTEFLEENWNAEIEAAVFNFRTRAYDTLPIEERNAGTFYRTRGARGRIKYGKNDLVFCGMIGPDHISPHRGIKLKLIPHSTGQKKCSGFAWFDYAYLAPGQSTGKININTAPPPVLSALPGMPLTVANNVAAGRGDGTRKLKPYRTTGDILDVQGMTPDIYGRICNLITTASDQYRVKIVGQAIMPHNAGSNGNQRVIAETRLDVVIVRNKDAATSGDSPAFTVSSAR